MVRKIVSRSEFTKNVLTLLTGTTLAQAIPFAISPILTRLFSPEDFGVFFVFSSIVAIGSIIVTAKYELAVLLPEKDEDAINIVAIALLITMVVSLFTLLGILFFREEIQELLNDTTEGLWLYLVPLSLFLVGLFQSFNYWHTRKKKFKIMAVSKVCQAGTTGTSNLFIGLSSGNGFGLICSTIIGQFVAVLILITRFIKHDGKLCVYINTSNIKSQAVRYKAFPGLMVFGNMFNISAFQLPNILLSSILGTGFIGLYALSQRVIKTPLTIISTSFGDVFKQRAAELVAGNNSCRGLFVKSITTLALFSLPFFTVFYLYAPSLFAFTFGEEWREAGEYAKVLAPYFWLGFVVGPMTHIFYILEYQRTYALIQSALLMAILLVVFSGTINSIEIVTMLSLSYSSIYILMAFVLWKIT
ncbi:MAG TPA: hypothetical protein EYM84_09950 [Flavobacteriales bacterium]|nr:hypothetical protein [Flavobacteriales bacterium]HIN40582.1 hypothetical protein [Flavobacteriales bacterium]